VITPEVFHGCDVDQERDLLSHRHEHQPAGVTRLSFAGTTDRIGVRYIPFLGAELASGDLYDLWARIETTLAADPDQSRAILERHLASMTT
jgi:hypothetical protein